MSDNKTNSGTLWENPNKGDEGHPDLSGKINIEGREYSVSGWLMSDPDSSNTPAITLSVQYMGSQLIDSHFYDSKINPGASIKVAQQLTGISSAKMCEDYGVVRQQLFRWTSASDMRLFKIREFADYFGVPFCEFLELGVHPEVVNKVGDKVVIDSGRLSIGSSVRAALRINGLSNADMARAFGVARQQVQRWVSSDDMLLSRAIEFAEYFEMDFCVFLKLGTEK